VGDPYETLRFEPDGDGVVTVTFDRPARLNAISIEMIDELGDVWRRLARDTRQRVVILHGAGRAFCAGTDLKEDIDSWPEDLGYVQSRVRLQERLSELPLLMREIPQPIVAAVHGAAAGGGMSFAAASDIRVVDETARFNAAFVRIGLSAGDVGASWTLPRLVGLSRAAELLYTGRFFDAEEALRIGFASRLVPPGTHLDAAREIAGDILRNSPLGIRMTKTLLAQTLDAPSIRSHIELENRTQILCTLTDDFAEGAQSFVERREPRYTDR
jgi:enoyl-CoA hydratase